MIIYQPKTNLISTHVPTILTDFKNTVKESVSDILVVDLINVTRIDSTGLNFLVSIYKNWEQKVKIAIINASDFIKNILISVGLSEYFDVR